MVWVQLALVPIVYLMMYAIDGKPYIWRWNLLSWVMLTGYIIGVLAWPFSRGIDKPKILKWWLRIDFVATILLFIPFHFTFILSRSDFLAERGMYVLYRTGGWMTTPIIRIGVKQGFLIKEIHSVGSHGFVDSNLDWIINDNIGYCELKVKDLSYSTIDVFPIDSIVYHKHRKIIKKKIDSLFYIRCDNDERLAFVMPDDFSTIEYRDSSSITYHRSDYIQLADIEYRSYETGNLLDSVLITLSISENDILPITDSDTLLMEGIRTERQIKLPKDSVPWMSPTEVQRFINNLERRSGQ